MTFITSTHDLGGFPTDAPITPDNPGRSRYCYLFPKLAEDGALRRDYLPGIFSDSRGDEKETIVRLLAIAKWIEQNNPRPSPFDASLRIQTPAAYTYFAQFVNHDISAPVGGMLVDVNAIPNPSTIGNPHLFPGKMWRGTTGQILDHFQNEHEHPLTLTSLYGEGPFPVNGHPPGAESRALFDAEGVHFLLGQTREVHAGELVNGHRLPDNVETVSGDYDIPRETNPARPARPLIADGRNDGNLILSQMHLAFMRFHNKAADALRPTHPDPADCFAAARLLVTRHYHWCILHDLLPRLLSKTLLAKLDLNAKARLPTAEVPMEFTTAAFRFGHSMIADSYDYNANFGREAIVARSASLDNLFRFTTELAMNQAGEYSRLPSHWVVDWDRLTDPDREGLGRADKIDMAFAGMMMNAVPKHNDGMGSIIARNLARGFHRRIAFGQELAKACDAPILDADQIRNAMPRKLQGDPAHPEIGDDKLKILASETPAWLYFLCEAQVLEQGERVGPAASQIIADTFIGLMQHNADSILGAKGRGWQPAESPLKTAAGTPIVTLRDLLLFSACR